MMVSNLLSAGVNWSGTTFMPVVSAELNGVNWDANSGKPLTLITARTLKMPCNCKDGSVITQSIHAPEIEDNGSLQRYSANSNSKKTDERIIAVSNSRPHVVSSTENDDGAGELQSPEIEKASPSCTAKKSMLHSPHSASRNNAECVSATESKTDYMKGIQNQLTSLKQLCDNPKLHLWQNMHGNIKKGGHDVDNGDCGALKNNSDVTARSQFSSNESSDTEPDGDALRLSKRGEDHNDASATYTVTKPIHHVGGNRLSVQDKSHGVRNGAALSSNDLIKLLRKFNMTLKAVPADSEIAKNIAKTSRRFNGVVADSRLESFRASEFRVIKCPSTALNKSTKSSSIARCRPHCKTTCTGTFSKWKLDESFLKSRSTYSSNNSDPKVDNKKGGSRLTTHRIAKLSKRQLTTCRNLNSIQGCKENTLNNDAHSTKGSATSSTHMPLYDIPLATAFDDLDNRDKATRETLEIFSESRSERESMSVSASDALLVSVNSSNDPLLTAAAFQPTNDEVDDEFSSRLSTVIIRPAKHSLDQHDDSSVKMTSDCLEENWTRQDDGLFDGRKQQNVEAPTPGASSAAQSHVPHSDNNIVSTHENSEGFSTTDGSVQLESMDADHNYHSKDFNCLYSPKTGAWTPKEVLSWLSSTILQFTESDRAANDSSSREERHNITKKLFSHIRDDQGLLSITLDKLKQFCSNNSLARYLFERVQVLWQSRRKGSNMYGVGQCAISTPPTINATSMEQLEEAVNIDDLFTADGMFGSVDFSDAFDSQTGSYLKYLGNDSLHAPASFRNYDSIPATINHHYSTKAKASGAANQGEYSAIRFMQSQRHEFYDYSAHYDFHAPAFNGTSYISHAGKVAAADHNSTVNNTVSAGDWPSSTTQNSDTHLYPAPMSPSTYYNLSAVGHGHSSLAHNGGCTSAGSVSASFHSHQSRDSTCRYANVIVGFRETSDNDSGIHSPSLQSPTKHIGMSAAVTTRNMYEFDQHDFHHQTYASRKRYLPMCSEMKSSWTDTSDVAVSMQTSLPRHKQCSEEKWDCSSTSSNTTAVSAGSESKLLNMDDCKSFHAYEFPESATHHPQSVAYSRSSSPSTDNFTAVEAKLYSHIESVEGFMQRNVTTIYPELVSQVQRSVSMNESGACSPIAQDTMSNMLQGDSIESNGDVSSVLRMSDKEDGAEYPISGVTRNRPLSNRRHTSDNADPYADNFDLKIRRTSGKSITLWEFIRDTLLDPQYCPRLIKWEDRKAGIFRFVQSDVVAGMWGDKKNNPKMTYEKLSRAMRYYYNRGILERVDGRRLVYKFGRNAHGWQQDELDHSISSRYIREGKSVKRETIVDYPHTHPKPKPRKIKPCRIPVSHCDEIIPATKRRRESRESSPAYLSINTTETASETHLLASFHNHTKNIVTSNTNRESLLSTTLPVEDEIQTPSGASRGGAILGQPSCIVFVARQDQMTNNEESDKKEILLLEKANDSSTWAQNTQEILPSKLPSANVLLGKQYKIANTVI